MCTARPGCMAKAKVTGIILQVSELNTAFRGTPCSLCFLRLVPNQGSDPKKCDLRLLRRQHFEGSEPWAGARRREKKKKRAKARHIKKNKSFFFGSTAGEVQEESGMTPVAETARTCRSRAVDALIGLWARKKEQGKRGKKEKGWKGV